MSNPASKSELLAALSSAATAQGLAVRPEGDGALRGEKEAIKAKWFLGGNKSVYSFSCKLDEPKHVATFREMIFDKAWGIAPPTFKVETYSQKGTTVSSRREQKSVGGGGTVELGPWREACAAAVAKAGWQFKHEPTKVP